MYVFIYQIKSENFEHNQYAVINGSAFWEALACFYTGLAKGEEDFLSPPIFLKAIKSLDGPEEMLEFFTSVTMGNIRITDAFSGATRIYVGQALDHA